MGMTKLNISALPAQGGTALIWISGPIDVGEGDGVGYAMRLLPVSEMKDWRQIWANDDVVARGPRELRGSDE